MNVNEAHRQSAAIIDHLRGSGYDEDADDLQLLIDDLLSAPDEESREKVATDIKRRCHIKWLGDVEAKGVGFTEWLRLLDGLRDAVD